MAKQREGVEYSPSYAGALAPRGDVTRQDVELTDLQSLLDCQQNFSLSLSHTYYLPTNLGPSPLRTGSLCTMCESEVKLTHIHSTSVTVEVKLTHTRSTSV